MTSREAYSFFRAHAGYVVGRNAEGALALARAEGVLHRAVDAGVASVEWVDDEMPLDIDDDGSTLRAIESGELVGPGGCVVRVDGEVVASLWGIVVRAPSWAGDDPYVRVVEAELASEVVDELRQACGDALDSVLLDRASLVRVGLVV